MCIMTVYSAQCISRSSHLAYYINHIKNQQPQSMSVKIELSIDSSWTTQNRFAINCNQTIINGIKEGSFQCDWYDRRNPIVWPKSNFGKPNSGSDKQAGNVLHAYTHMHTWSDLKISKLLALVSILIYNILLVLNQDFVMKTLLWLNSKN